MAPSSRWKESSTASRLATVAAVPDDEHTYTFIRMYWRALIRCHLCQTCLYPDFLSLVLSLILGNGAPCVTYYGRSLLGFLSLRFFAMFWFTLSTF